MSKRIHVSRAQVKQQNSSTRELATPFLLGDQAIGKVKPLVAADDGDLKDGAAEELLRLREHAAELARGDSERAEEPRAYDDPIQLAQAGTAAGASGLGAAPVQGTGAGLTGVGLAGAGSVAIEAAGV